MGFMDSYKRLERLCRDIFRDEKPVKAYIEAMKNTPGGAYRVRGWEEDLKRLKHYLWVRNQISHEPGCTEENMCTEEDAWWLEDFYTRIMQQTDPLALYRKATQPQPKPEKPAPVRQTYNPQPERYVQPRRSSSGCLPFFLIAMLAFLIVVILMIK